MGEVMLPLSWEYEYMERLRKDPTLKRQDYTATRFPQIWLDPAMPPDSESTQN